MKCIAELVVCLRIVRLQLNRLAQFVDGFAIALEIVVTPAEIVLRPGVIRSQGEALFVFLCCFSVLLGVVVIDVGESEMCETEFGLLSNSFLVRLDCFSIAAEISQCVTNFVVGFGVV